MAWLIIGLILFLGIHSVSIFALPLREGFVKKSEKGWKAVYSVISFVGLGLIFYGYGAARLEPVLVYSTPYWFRHITYLLMLFTMILVVAPYLPGKIKQVTKHPQLVAVKLWAFSHLLVNGMLADVILFGAFLAWAVLDRISMKKREQREVSSLKPRGLYDIIAIVVGVLLTGAFIMFLHAKIIGMPLVG